MTPGQTCWPACNACELKSRLAVHYRWKVWLPQTERQRHAAHTWLISTRAACLCQQGLSWCTEPRSHRLGPDPARRHIQVVQLMTVVPVSMHDMIRVIQACRAAACKMQHNRNIRYVWWSKCYLVTYSHRFMMTLINDDILTRTYKVYCAPHRQTPNTAAVIRALNSQH